MKRTSNLRSWLALILGVTGALLMIMSFEPARPPSQGGLKLALQKVNFSRTQLIKQGRSAHEPNIRVPPTTNDALPANAPTFGHPVISGIGGVAYGESFGLGPDDPT